MNIWLPRIEKTPKKNIKKRTTCAIAGMDMSRVLNCFFMLGTTFTLRRGFRTLKILRTFKFGLDGSIEMKLTTSTRKSKAFQASLR